MGAIYQLNVKNVMFFQPFSPPLRLCDMKPEKVYIEYLTLKAQTGDAKATDELMYLLNAKTKAFVLKVLGGSAAVDDCVQESLLKVFNKIKKLKEVKAIHTWLYRIVHSTCMDYIHKNPASHDLTEVSVDDSNQLDHQLDVKSAIATLPEAQQVIVYLFYYEGFNVAQVADILSKPAGTVKYLLFTARQAIKSKLSSNSNN